MASKKIPLDKYYTSQELADYCVQKAIDVIGKENITELIESSAGNGVFLNSFEKLLPDVPYLAYDIEPEDNRIIKQDYLTLDLDYKKGRCVIGNPPFGKNTLSKSFVKNSYNFSDYVAFILPISQYKNNYEVYEFDLIHSEDLSSVNYSGRYVRCCFNVYKRPCNKLNKKPNYKLKDVVLYEYRRNEKEVPNIDYDYRMCSYGNIGKVCDYDGQYVKEICVKINKNKEKVLDILSNANWRNIVFTTTIPSLPQWQVYKYLKEHIPELN